MEFNEALSIVLTLAIAHRVVAPVEVSVTDEQLDEAIEMVKGRLDGLLKRPKSTKRGSHAKS